MFFFFARWVESEPDRGDYQPLDISYGEIGIFHGTLCRHHVPKNSSDFTRVSMDFRIGLGETWIMALAGPGGGFVAVELRVLVFSGFFPSTQNDKG